MAIKERHQNPVPNDTVNLRLVTFNSNMPADVSSIQQVDTYFLDPSLCNGQPTCAANPRDGRRHIETIPSSQITETDIGQYLLPLVTSEPLYTIGKYLDVWSVVFQANDNIATIENRFELYPNLWYATTLPAVYSFDFQFQPNRIRKGSIKWLIIKIIPNVPRATDLERYYTNLAISADLKISIEQSCGPCPPQPGGADLLVDDDLVTVRDKCFAFYRVDTTDDGPGFECGNIYNVWFTLCYAGSVDVSEKMQLQIY